MHLRLALVAVSVLLSGCADAPATPGSPDTTGADAVTDPSSDSAGLEVVEGDEALVFTVETFVHSSTLQVAARVPPVVGAPIEHEEDDAPLTVEVPAGVDNLFMELVWSDRVQGLDRGDLSLRAIDASDHYFYGGGQAGTPEDPVWLRLDRFTSPLEVSPVASDLTADQDYEIHVSLITGDVPEDFTAIGSKGLDRTWSLE